ncbi:hypothetical protein PILCRDRAFT_568223 [Piloderma croceum F 1598]|uniref:Uncharacterized protein n=1 Tax=Piloderma croceum (strain F 1598) TaxID=765440 RepID=A0A0C3FHS9_PILCF|nr:hypothetical protein PILCRDRAFT_568223 [Piloderma croceum F 1598]
MSRTIGSRFNGCCAICLLELPDEGSQYTHLVEVAQVNLATRLGILGLYDAQFAEESRITQCPTCHLAFFAPKHVILSPPLEVLQFIITYLTTTPDPKPLHQVFESLNRARSNGSELADIPNSEQIIPFIGLYSLVTLRPSQVTSLRLITPHFPELSQRNGRHFTKAPENTLPNAPDVARIFSVRPYIRNSEEIYGRIPLSPSLPDFAERRFWRLPAQFGVVLAMLIEHALTADSTCEEIELARTILACDRVTVTAVSCVTFVQCWQTDWWWAEWGGTGWWGIRSSIYWNIQR